MTSYLQRLAQVFAQEVGEALPQYTFVFPNHRAGLFFRKYLGQAMSRPIFSPRIITINECFASLSHLRVANQLTLLMRLYTIYRELRPEADPIERFLHWGKMMLADFSEIDNHMVEDIKSLYTAVEDMHDIDDHFQELTPAQRNAIKKFWGDFYHNEDKKDNRIHTNFLRTWQLLYPMYQAFTEGLLKDQLAYEGLLHKQVIKHLEEQNIAIQQPYVFVGFNALTESERRLMTYMQKCGCADFYFDYEDKYVSDPANRSSLFMADNLQRFPSRFTIPPRTQHTRPEITLVTVNSTVGEAREVHNVLQNLYPSKEATYDLTRTAVVLPDEQLLIPLLDCFPESVKKINVTMGYPLRASNLYMLIAYPEKKISPMPTTGNTMITALRENLSKQSNAANTEAYYLITKALEEVENAIQLYPNIEFSADSVMQILRMLTMETSIPYAGEPLDGLQVMGVLETRALDFDNLIITDFNDDLYPGRSRGNSFIPYILRRGFGLPTPERQDAIFAYNFYRMLSYAQKVWFITNSAADVQRSGEVSRYLYQLQWQYGVKINMVSVVDQLSIPKIKQTEIIKTPEIIEQLTARIQRGLSASALNTYLLCQKKFFYSFVQDLREPKEIEDITATDATIGNVLHAVMKRLYDFPAARNITESVIENLLNSLVQDKIWEELPIDDIKTDYLARYVVKQYVNNILRYDKTQAPFIYLYGEQKIHHQLEVPQVGIVPFVGTIDRIDQKGNVLRIIDYKTGTASMEYNNMEHVFDRLQNQDKALQTLLYCWLLTHNRPSNVPEGLTLEPHIYHARSMANPNEVETIIHPQGSGCFVYNEEVETEFINGLINVIQEIYNQDIPFAATEKEKRCSSCAFFALCKG